jgi:hypothetical protein
MYIAIENNLNNNEWKVLCMHMQLVLLTLIKKVNVFKVKDLERAMHYNGIQFQRDELAPSSTF